MLKITAKFTSEETEKPEEIILLDDQNHLTRDGILLCALDLLTDAGLFALLFAMIRKYQKK